MTAWLLAVRPKTLVCAVVPIAVGSAVADRSGAFRLDVALAALIASMLIQIGTNLANDVFDWEQGADTRDRLGPPRAVASGLLSARAVKRAMRLVFLAAILAGTYIVYAAGWMMIPLGLACVAAGVAYTKGKRSLGYLGLGDLFVFVFFGVVAVAGTAYAQSGELSALAVSAGVPIGALANILLVVNNVRDRRTDGAAGKRTLIVRFGRRFGEIEAFALASIAYAVPVALFLLGLAPARVLLTLATLPLALWVIRELLQKDGRELNATLARSAGLLLAFGALFAIGIATPGGG
jgi:1,4-dihydroxy-2-naphthoate polyprenyltransferase